MIGNVGELFVLLLAVVVSWQGKFEGHVVGGKYADIRYVPHSALLVVRCDEEWICGSSVLTHKVLLTAAHCLWDIRNHAKCKIVAFAGHENLEKVKVLRRIRRYVIHERYDDQNLVHDVAVAMVRTPLELGPHIKRVILLSRSRVRVGDTGTVAGWGITDEQKKTDTIRLKVARITIRGQSWCDYIGSLSSGMFCAGSLEGHDDRPAEGDSGSALIMDNFQQIGLVSFKALDYPALVVYTNVSYYFRWIRENSINLSCMRRHGWEEV